MPIVGLGVGFVVGALWNAPVYDSGQNVDEGLEREIELMRKLSEVRRSVATLEMKYAPSGSDAQKTARRLLLR